MQLSLHSTSPTSVWCKEIFPQFLVALVSLSKCSLGSELLSFPEDLRAVLEELLAEEANPANLDLYLPRVREIITNLLQGLRTRQTEYRRNAQGERTRTRTRPAASAPVQTKETVEREGFIRPESAEIPVPTYVPFQRRRICHWVSNLWFIA